MACLRKLRSYSRQRANTGNGRLTNLLVAYQADIVTGATQTKYHHREENTSPHHQSVTHCITWAAHPSTIKQQTPRPISH